MRVVLDEGVPEPLGRYLVGHNVSTVKREGWESIKNGQLLDLIEKAGFEAFITNDKQMEYQQELGRRPFVSLLLSTNHWPTVRAQVEKIKIALNAAEPRKPLRVDCGRFIPKRFRKSEL